MKYKILVLLLLIATSYTKTAFSQSWELKMNQDGVKVYTRSYEGSNVVEFKGEVTVKSNMAGVLKIIDSVSEYPKWMHNCAYSRRIKKINESSGYSYYVVKAPWPVSDRDACIYYKVSQDESSKIVTIAITGVKDYLPEESGRVRVPKVNATWQLIPVSKGVTKVTYQAHSEIGGYVPAVIVNAYITESPYYNLLHIKNMVESPLYPKVTMDNVKEL